MSPQSWGIAFILPFQVTFSQINTFPFTERFDSVQAPLLPAGWETSTNRSPGGDFFTTSTSPRSVPLAVQSTNSTVPQSLVSPVLDFSSRIPDQLRFYLARSGTHTSQVLIEASTDGGATWPVICSDTLLHPGPTGYVQTIIELPKTLANQPVVRFRWRNLGGTGGAAGTLRLDDVVLSVFTSFDLAVTSMTFQPPRPVDSDVLRLTSNVFSLGILSSSEFQVHFFLDGNSDGVADGTERFAHFDAGLLMSGDTAAITVQHPPLPAGIHRFLSVADLTDDENASNDTGSVIVSVGANRGSLILNEIMYEPLLDQGEWIEILNPGMLSVQLAGWALRDAPTASGSTNRSPLNSSLNIGPGEFGVIAADSTILTLFPSLAFDPRLLILNLPGGLGMSNSGDAIILEDLNGATIDSVHFSPSWHHSLVDDVRGRALERIRPDHDSNDPRNWSTSADPRGGSPGSRNTIFTPSVPSGSSLSFAPNPFSPDGDGREDFCIVRYSIPIPSSIIHIRIFDLRGRLIRTLADAEPSGSTGEIIWDGMESSNRKARIGPHIVHLEAAGSNGEVFTARGVLVVAAAL